MIKTHWLAAVAVAAAGIVQAGEVAGTVKTSRGEVTIERAGQRLQAAVGSEVLAADRIRTGPDGAVGITLRDDTLLSAGPNSSLAVDRFVFDSTTHAGQATTSLRRGTLAVVTGKLAKEAPESVQFRTPTSVLGVRGTEFAVEVAAGEED